MSLPHRPLEAAASGDEPTDHWRRYEAELDEAMVNPYWDIFRFTEALPERSEIVRVVGLFLANRLLQGTEHQCRRVLGSVSKFLAMVQEGYRQTYGYHTRIHAADTAITLYQMIQVYEGSHQLDPLDELAAILAAFAHDVGHPGWSNSFAKALGTGDADDPHPLESMHARETAKMLAAAGLDGLLGPKRLCMIQEMILCTCMDYHSRMVEKAQNYVNEDLPSRLSVLLHAADISNPTKEARLSQLWSIRSSFEFWREHDLSRKVGVTPPVSVPSRSLTSPGYALCQLAFYKNVAFPLFAALGPNSEWTVRLLSNIQSRIDLIAAYAPPPIEPTKQWRATGPELDDESADSIEDEALCSSDGEPVVTPSVSSERDPDADVQASRRRSSLFRATTIGK
ncbi:Calcium/calmodulin-dependent 3',5'-cyclic nucleotide phosphodiesterase 1B [Perkinsus olseni]|uniref:Calcium/calmodulin-dependent 3',5'-cyclic nucleotide phosphodiesterase 1B n=1 Tax=Perkinsus olseni TaxID=32597 RepID=A0A7J6MJ73_PEROL|nr:Calcium/calmodulin-dependent 3',5'-cyclic nucleotide phosphodiesterase 1B [Perkinsus olseni]KAF4673356.1 Calcium/calmodulin-dependent 3',5'-cyclic nucleotide phosphodiesterase 1B [Perkinsus olseni]